MNWVLHQRRWLGADGVHRSHCAACKKARTPVRDQGVLRAAGLDVAEVVAKRLQHCAVVGGHRTSLAMGRGMMVSVGAVRRSSVARLNATPEHADLLVREVPQQSASRSPVTNAATG